jgi:hypothetical protein
MNDEELADIEASITTVSSEEESAPPEEEKEEIIETEETPEDELEGDEPSEPEKPKVPKGFQKRINKRTADYYREKNRADELEKKIADLEAQRPVDVGSKPKIEDFDFDEAAHQEALLDWKLEQKVAKIQLKTKAQQAKANADTVLEQYQRKVETSGLEDFDEVVTPLYQNKILGDAAYEALLIQDNGPLIEYHLAKNLELAAKIGSKTPAQQAAEIGKLSVKLAAPKGRKTTKAPDPVKPAKSGGGGLSKDATEMSMDELMEDDRY